MSREDRQDVREMFVETVKKQEERGKPAMRRAARNEAERKRAREMQIILSKRVF